MSDVIPPLPRKYQIRVAKVYCKIITPMRTEARKLGYALGVHGSIKRDIDIIAAPWTESAVEASVLAEALLLTCREVMGFAEFGADGPWPRTHKPHGRLCWTIHFHGTYVDLSIMPRHEPTVHGI